MHLSVLLEWLQVDLKFGVWSLERCKIPPFLYTIFPVYGLDLRGDERDWCHEILLVFLAIVLHHITT